MHFRMETEQGQGRSTAFFFFPSLSSLRYHGNGGETGELSKTRRVGRGMLSFIPAEGGSERQRSSRTAHDRLDRVRSEQPICAVVVPLRSRDAPFRPHPTSKSSIQHAPATEVGVSGAHERRVVPRRQIRTFPP